MSTARADPGARREGEHRRCPRGRPRSRDHAEPGAAALRSPVSLTAGRSSSHGLRARHALAPSTNGCACVARARARRPARRPADGARRQRLHADDAPRGAAPKLVSPATARRRSRSRRAAPAGPIATLSSRAVDGRRVRDRAGSERAGARAWRQDAVRALAQYRSRATASRSRRSRRRQAREEPARGRQGRRPLRADRRPVRSTGAPSWHRRRMAAAASAIARITLERLFRDQLQPKAYACYQRVLGTRPSSRHRALRLPLGRGEVTSVALVGLGEAQLDACLLDAAYQLTLPLPDFTVTPMTRRSPATADVRARREPAAGRARRRRLDVAARHRRDPGRRPGKRGPVKSTRPRPRHDASEQDALGALGVHRDGWSGREVRVLRRG